MQEDALYNTIISNSWTDNIDDYFTFLIQQAREYTNNEVEVYKLIDLSLKKILNNLKRKIDISIYDNLIINLGIYNNQDGYDFAIGLIKSYYDNEFIIKGKEYSTLDIMVTIINEYQEKNTISIPRIFHYILNALFKIHYVLCIKE